MLKVQLELSVHHRKRGANIRYDTQIRYTKESLFNNFFLLYQRRKWEVHYLRNQNEKLILMVGYCRVFSARDTTQEGSDAREDRDKKQQKTRFETGVSV